MFDNRPSRAEQNRRYNLESAKRHRDEQRSNSAPRRKPKKPERQSSFFNSAIPEGDFERYNALLKASFSVYYSILYFAVAGFILGVSLFIASSFYYPETFSKVTFGGHYFMTVMVGLFSGSALAFVFAFIIRAIAGVMSIVAIFWIPITILVLGILIFAGYRYVT